MMNAKNLFFPQTYNLNAQTGESSACATALLCGVKANYETVGLDGRANFENCSSSFGSRVSSILEWAQQAGMLFTYFFGIEWLSLQKLSIQILLSWKAFFHLEHIC